MEIHVLLVNLVCLKESFTSNVDALMDIMILEHKNNVRRV
jgi:hypothetical protein